MQDKQVVVVGKEGEVKEQPFEVNVNGDNLLLKKDKDGKNDLNLTSGSG